MTKTFDMWVVMASSKEGPLAPTACAPTEDDAYRVATEGVDLLHLMAQSTKTKETLTELERYIDSVKVMPARIIVSEDQ